MCQNAAGIPGVGIGAIKDQYLPSPVLWNRKKMSPIRMCQNTTGARYTKRSESESLIVEIDAKKIPGG